MADTGLDRADASLTSDNVWQSVALKRCGYGRPSYITPGGLETSGQSAYR